MPGATDVIHERELDTQLLSAIARLNRWVTARAQHSVAMPVAQLRLLSLIEQLGAARTTEIAEADHSSQPTITQQLRKLGDQGWIVRTEDENDARASLISLSRNGSRELDTARRARGTALRPYLDELEDEDRAALAAAVPVLARLADSLGPPRHPGAS